MRRFKIPGAGTSAHAFTLVHTTADGPDEAAAFKSQIEALGVGTTLLVDTYDITDGVATAVAVAGPELGGVRIDSGDLGVLARQVREQLDDLGARNTKIVLSGDLDEYAIAALRAEPVDSYGVGTSLVTGSGAPTCGMVYKLVEVDGMPVVKRSSHKESRGGTKRALRRLRSTGTMTEEVVVPRRRRDPAASVRRTAIRSDQQRPSDQQGRSDEQRQLLVPMVREGEQVADLPGLGQARALVAQGLKALPWEGLKLSHGEPAIPTVFHS